MLPSPGLSHFRRSLALIRKLRHRTIDKPEDSHPPAGVLQIAAAIFMADQLN
jgi:hypothetical protein